MRWGATIAVVNDSKNWGVNVRSLLTLIAGIGTVAMVTLPATTAGASPISAATVRSHLLSLSDLPTGWSGRSSSKSPSELSGGGCLLPAKKETSGGARAAASFSGNPVPVFDESLAAGKANKAKLARFDHTLSTCKQFSITTSGTSISGTIGALSFPSVGGEVAAYQISIDKGVVTVDADVVTFKSGPYVGYILYADSTVPNVTQVATILRKAVAKADGLTAT